MKKIEEMNLKELKSAKANLEKINTELENLSSGKEVSSINHPFKVGENYFIRTVTMSLMGKLVSVCDKELVLENASWIADTGRFSDFLKGKITSELEVEPFPNEIIIGRGSIVDACIWEKEVYRTQK